MQTKNKNNMKYTLKIVKKNKASYLSGYTNMQDLLVVAYAIVALDPKNTEFFILEEK